MMNLSGISEEQLGKGNYWEHPSYVKPTMSFMDSLKQHAAVYAPLEQITNAAPKPLSVGPLASKIKDNIPPTSIMPGAAAKPASKKALIGAGILAAIFLATKGMGA